MKFNDRNYALLGIPDLPINAFRHIGDRKIKPQGGVTSFVDSVGGAIDDTVSSVSNVLADVDDTVNEDIPGGWATVAAVAGGAALASGVTAGTAAGATAADVAASNALAQANLAGYAGTAIPATAVGTGAVLSASGSPMTGFGTGTAGVNATNTAINTAGGSLGMGSLTQAIPSSLTSLGNAGTAIWEFAKANPSISGSLLGAVAGAIEASDAPTELTGSTSIDPQIKAEYLANLERAKQTAAGLEARQFAQPSAMYTGAEQQLYNLGMTPFGAADIAKFYNPYQEQVVQGALGDIERTRQMQEQANMAQATASRAFGGSRQGVVSGMTNEAALRQAATTGGQLRQQGFTQAANLGLAARPMDIAGLQTSLGLGATRTALDQAKLDALRDLGTQRLAITGGALGLQPANVGGTTTQPLYTSQSGSLLSGGLTGAYIGSLLKG